MISSTTGSDRAAELNGSDFVPGGASDQTAPAAGTQQCAWSVTTPAAQQWAAVIATYH
jgi:hypothetical protein